MKLTPFAKLFITVVILAVVGYAFWHYKGADIRKWAGRRQAGGRAGVAGRSAVGDFDALKNAPADPVRGTGLDGRHRRRRSRARASSRGRSSSASTPGPATRRASCSTPASTPNPASSYTQAFGLDVKFVLLEDPAAKLAAFRKGDVDIMWNTVDNWAREASILAEQNQKAKSIIMQDWSRGGDGIVSLASIKSIEDLKGKKIACTQFTPSHFLLLYLLSQSGLSPEDRSARREEHHLHAGRAGGRRDVQGEAGGRGRHVGAGPVRRRSTARGDEAHVLVSTTAATNIIADTLVRAAGPHRPGARRRVRDFVQGWFDGIEMIKADPARVVRGRRQGPEARHRDGVGDALGPEAHALRRQRAVLRADRRQGALRDALRHGVRHLAQEGPRDAAGRREGLGRHALHRARWRRPTRARRSRSRRSRPRPPSAQDRAIINKQIQIHFTPGSDEIMAGSYFVLDALGETMTSFGNTYLRVEGNTDSTGSPTANMTLSERRALAVKNYVLQELPEHPAGPVPDDRPRRGEPGGAQHDRGRAAAEPPHGHQGRPGRAVSAMASRPIGPVRAPGLRLPRMARRSCWGFVMPAARARRLVHRVATAASRRPTSCRRRPRSCAGTLQLFIEHDLGQRHLRLDPAHRASRSCWPPPLALPLGVLMGAFEPVNRLFEPIMAPLRYMPISAFIPLLILWFGIYESQKIAFLFLGVFVYLLPVVVTAIRAVPEELVQTGAHARRHRAGRWSGRSCCPPRCPRSSIRSA